MSERRDITAEIEDSSLITLEYQSCALEKELISLADKASKDNFIPYNDTLIALLFSINFISGPSIHIDMLTWCDANAIVKCLDKTALSL